jgi:hypothetical protein
MFRISQDDPIKRAERDLRQAKQKLTREARRKQEELITRKKATSAARQDKYPVWKLDVSLDSFYEDYSQDPAPNRRLRKEQSKERKEFFFLLIAFAFLTWIAIAILRHTLT